MQILDKTKPMFPMSKRKVVFGLRQYFSSFLQDDLFWPFGLLVTKDVLTTVKPA
jgi:hypothetical protein